MRFVQQKFRNIFTSTLPTCSSTCPTRSSEGIPRLVPLILRLVPLVPPFEAQKDWLPSRKGKVLFHLLNNFLIVDAVIH